MSTRLLEISNWIRDNWLNAVAALVVLVAAVFIVFAFASSVNNCYDQGGRFVTETEWHYHYGLNPINGEFEFFYGPDSTTECQLPE